MVSRERARKVEPIPIRSYAGTLVGGVHTSIEHLARALHAELLQPFVRQGFMTMPEQGPRLEIRTDVRTPYYFASARDGLAKCSSPTADENMRMWLEPAFRAHLSFLREINGVLFVADSQVERAEANAGFLARLSDDLRAEGRDPNEIPLVLQCNKRDLPNVMPIEDDGGRRALADTRALLVSRSDRRRHSRGAQHAA